LISRKKQIIQMQFTTKMMLNLLNDLLDLA
jgi:hypothetical protein